MEIITLDNPTKIFEAKTKIEQIEKDIVDMPINDFIEWLDMKNYLYITENNVIPFRIYKNSNIEYTFIINDEEYKDAINNLSNIKYNLSGLKEVSIDDVYQGKLENLPYYYIINSKYMIEKDTKI